MGFVCERISEGDRNDIGVEGFEGRKVGGYDPYQWVVDRERKIYFWGVADHGSSLSGQEEGSNITEWVLVYEKYRVNIKLDCLDYRTEFGGSGWYKLKIVDFQSEGAQLNTEDEINMLTKFLEQALVEYKDAGINSGCKEFSIDLVK